MSRHRLRDQRGSVLALTFLALLLLSALALSLGTISLANWETERRDGATDLAAYVARAALERSCSEVLLGSSDWATLGTGTMYSAESFGAGSYDVELLTASTNAATLRVHATTSDAKTSLQFQLQRLTAGGGGSGATTGVKILVVRDLTLEATFG